ncbi:hypothetical protein [Maricaulis maris]|uniref:hypothetical protein n=1 Tax=Maricaulis maris TaxID=74318 RepID=UPI00291D1034|nr:hypothetical protein MACH15_12350 [Maricaulis maris]
MRNIESYLFDKEVLSALCEHVGSPEKVDEVHAAFDTAVAGLHSRKKAPDDIKAASGLIYTEVKRKLALTKCGNSARKFMQRTLAPLITPKMNVYRLLETDIFAA